MSLHDMPPCVSLKMSDMCVVASPMNVLKIFISKELFHGQRGGYYPDLFASFKDVIQINCIGFHATAGSVVISIMSFSM